MPERPPSSHLGRDMHALRAVEVAAALLHALLDGCILVHARLQLPVNSAENEQVREGESGKHGQVGLMVLGRRDRCLNASCHARLQLPIHYREEERKREQVLLGPARVMLQLASTHTRTEHAHDVRMCAHTCTSAQGIIHRMYATGFRVWVAHAWSLNRK